MTLEQLRTLLLNDIKAVGGDVTGFELVLRPYSKTYYGRYIPSRKRVIVYVYQDSDLSELYPYEDLFATTLHEFTHHVQWSDPNFVRIKGVMHNAEFYRIYNTFMQKHKDRR